MLKELILIFLVRNACSNQQLSILFSIDKKINNIACKFDDNALCIAHVMIPVTFSKNENTCFNLYRKINQNMLLGTISGKIDN